MTHDLACGFLCSASPAAVTSRLIVKLLFLATVEPTVLSCVVVSVRGIVLGVLGMSVAFPFVVDVVGGVVVVMFRVVVVFLVGIVVVVVVVVVFVVFVVLLWICKCEVGSAVVGPRNKKNWPC